MDGAIKNCPERKKNFHSDILPKFFKRLDGWSNLKLAVQRERKNFHSDILLNFYCENLKGLVQMERLSRRAARELGLILRP
jgi:hypothetical protein